MNNELYFDLAEVVRVAEATAEATEHGDSFSDREDGKKTGPALVWAKDAGTYLLSNAVPRPENDVIYGRAYAHDGLLLQQPDDSRTAGWEDVWHTTREICGGDDFAEYLGLDGLLPQMQTALRGGLTHLVLVVSAEAIDIRMERAK